MNFFRTSKTLQLAKSLRIHTLERYRISFNYKMTSLPMMPQLLSTTISLIAVIIGSLSLQKTGSLNTVGHYSSLVFPFVAAVELLKFLIIGKCCHIPENIFAKVLGSGGSKANNNINTTLLNRLKDFSKAVVVFTFATIFFACTAVIFGAPLFVNYEATISISTILASLSILPLQLFVGSRYTVLALLTHKLEFGKLAVEQHLDFLKCAAAGAVMGAWGSSVVMPLDWDKPYQLYPTPQIVGAVAGHLLGSVFFVIKTVLFNAKAELKKKSIL